MTSDLQDRYEQTTAQTFPACPLQQFSEHHIVNYDAVNYY